MPKVTFIQPDGAEQTIEIATGHSIMEGAVKNDVRGIDADCGGSCACATCHVFVAEEWMDRLDAPDEIEAAMLEFAIDPDDSSRLSCQIKMTAALEGLTLRLPKSQR